jgi:hypothetical protein
MIWILVVVITLHSGALATHTSQYFNQESCEAVWALYKASETRKVIVSGGCTQIDERDR